MGGFPGEPLPGKRKYPIQPSPSRKDLLRFVRHQGSKPKIATLFVVPTNTFPFAIVGGTYLL
jgi:hypothetical protein